MKLGLQNYTVNVPIDNIYIKFNNNNLNSLQTYGIAQNYRNLHKVVQRFLQHNLKMWNHRHIQKLRQRR
jgi:ssDNA-specific exonuclease RecJ